MDNPIKISASSVSHCGRGYSVNEDNFYINGRYKYDYEMDNIQVSMDCLTKNHIFAVSDGLDRAATEKRPSISMVKEIKKFQEQLNVKSGDFESKVGLLKDRLEETNNIIYSMSLSDNLSSAVEKRTSFASFFISEGRAVALNIGKTRAYLFRDGVLRQLTGDIKKADKLLRMGIITNEQANLLTGKFGIPVEESIAAIQKSEILEIKQGDLFIACTDGLAGVLDEEKINEVLLVDKETSFVSNMLVKEALKNGAKDNITALVIKVEVQNSFENEKTKEQFPVKRTKIQGSVKKNKSYTAIKIASAAVVVSLAVLFGIMAIHNYFSKDPGPPLVPEDKIVSVSEVTTDNAGTIGTSATTDTQSHGEGQETDNSKGDYNQNGERTHTVVAGDTLQKISKKYYNDPQKYQIIMEKNNLTNPNQIKIGQVLIIPED